MSSTVAQLPPLRREFLGESIAEAVREAVLSGQLKPGAAISEAQIATQLGVSRASVRNGLALLEQERIVCRTPSRRVRVTILSRRDAEEIYTLRSALERLAVLRAMEKDSKGLEARLREANQYILGAVESVQLVDRDLKFHETLVRAADHDRLLESRLKIRSQIRRLIVHREVFDPRPAEITYELHQRIVTAVASGDRRLAADVIEEQIGRRQIAWFEHLFPGGPDALYRDSESSADGSAAGMRETELDDGFTRTVTVEDEPPRFVGSQL